MKGPNKILAVDDDNINLIAIEHMLKSFGFETVIARSGTEALDRLTDQIRLVLLDVMMPGMDGFEVARHIRQRPEYVDVPIIMVTGLTGKEDRLKAVQAGANDFVSKPIDPIELEIRISSHLKLRDARYRRRESDARYRMLVENSPVGILCCNPAGEVTEINSAAAALFGIPKGEQGIALNLFDNRDLAESGVAEVLKDGLRTGEMVVNEFPVGRKRYRHAKLYIVPVRSDDGRVMGMQIVSEDVTYQKRADEAGRRSTRLKAFAEMARASVHHFSEALETIGKDVDAGLAAVATGSHLQAGASFGKIRVAGDRALLTLRLLEKFALGYTHRDVPKSAGFDLGLAVNDALEATKPSWELEPQAKGIPISMECELAEGCMLHGERADIVDLTANLVRNAAEAMPQGGVLRVKTSCDEDNVVLEVQDEGIGLTQEQMRRIGEPFWTSKPSHVGLGLASSCGIIRRHFGTLSITSKKGRGTIFAVKFPLTHSAKEVSEDATQTIPLSNLKVLFISPEEGSANKIARELKERGLTYRTRTVDEAIRIFDEKYVDAIVCSEWVGSADIVDLSNKVSLFCAGKGTFRPPLIILADEEGFDQSEPGFSDIYVDRIVRNTIDIAGLMAIVGEEVWAGMSRPRLAGTLGQIDILEVVQMMMLSGQKLVLEVMSQDGKRGLLYISNGELCHAKTEALEGEAAAYWALSLKAGSFSTLAFAEPKRRTIGEPGYLILMEAARRRDEAQDPSGG
ncbi:MAG: response regulator [Pseudomonadota bacterium]